MHLNDKASLSHNKKGDEDDAEFHFSVTQSQKDAQVVCFNRNTKTQKETQITEQTTNLREITKRKKIKIG